MKYALFTGAAGGLGSACSLEMAKNGWIVFVADINEKALEKMGKNKNIIPIKLDVTDRSSIDNARVEIEKTTDSLDAVINFVGVHAMVSMVEGTSPDTIEKMLKINLMGMIRVNRVFFDLIKKGKGRIINCSSECGWMKPQPFNGPYAITKHAIEAYNDSLRRELMFIGIPVIKIQPGPFKTNLLNDIRASFDSLYDSTKIYKKTLKKMKPLMDIELKVANDPKYLVNVLIKAVETNHPKIKYRVKTSKLTGLLELIPDRAVDFIYKAAIK